MVADRTDRVLGLWKWPVVAGIVFIGGFIALMAYSSFGTRVAVEVCVTYDGRTACGKAASEKREEAERTATSMACTQLASGMTSTLQCEQSPQRKVTWKP